jgi:FtsP/CotA-like multicopper oxidase with cupredoxin domain
MKEGEENSLSRRHFLMASALAGGGLVLPISARAQNSMPMPMQSATPSALDQGGAADVTLRIATGLLELAPDHIVSTTLYNGQFPGPLLRFSKADIEAQEKTKGYEVGYDLFSINGKMLGQGEPLKVKQGERVLFHVLNASATEIRSLALPGHSFHVVSLDGNPVPNPADVPVLWIGTAERISAIVEMNHPGVWVMGDLADDDRGHGMGIVVEYGGRSGEPQWVKPEPYRWDYTMFAKPGATGDCLRTLTHHRSLHQTSCATSLDQYFCRPPDNQAANHALTRSTRVAMRPASGCTMYSRLKFFE